MITASANPQVKQVCAYQKKKKDRDRDGVFVAEGERLVLEVPRERIVALYLSASCRLEASDGLKRFLHACEKKTQVVSDDVFFKMSDTKTPQGILAVVKKADDFPDTGRFLAALQEARKGGTSKNAAQTAPVLVLESIRDPGNLGTMLRTAEAAGVKGVILCAETADPYQPKAVRASMGSIFRMQLRQEETVAEAASSLRAAGCRIVCADMDGNTDYDLFDWKAPCALVIGNEANGLTDAAKQAADEILRIPMAGKNESLNAASACAVMLFEAARQLRRA